MPKKYFILLITVAVLIGCTRDNFLDFQPKGVVIPSKVEDFRSLLDQVDEDFRSREISISQGFGRQHSTNVFMSDNQFIDEDIFVVLGPEQFQTRTYLFDAFPFNTSEDDEDWNLYYNHIYTANVILQGLESLSDGDPSEIDQLRAEARLHRAYAYFNLVNIYGLHYNPATAGTDLGVPIREGVLLEGLDLTRASVQETYDYLLADIIESIADLKDVQPIELSFRPSKAGAYGLLAKVYLYQANYQAALEACTNGLALKSTVRNIANDAESSFYEDVLSFPIAREDEQIIWFKQARFQDIFPSDALINLYDSDDLRLLWYTNVEAVYGIEKSERLYYTAAEDNANYYMGINTTDLYLIRAECNARLGNLPAANDDLNEIRRNRFATSDYEAVNIADQAALLTFVKEERRREMVGSVERTFDIKRYNLFDDAGIGVTHSLNGQSATLSPNSNNWAFPIASKYIQQNPEIEQNPRD